MVSIEIKNCVGWGAEKSWRGDKQNTLFMCMAFSRSK